MSIGLKGDQTFKYCMPACLISFHKRKKNALHKGRNGLRIKLFCFDRHAYVHAVSWNMRTQNCSAAFSFHSTTFLGLFPLTASSELKKNPSHQHQSRQHLQNVRRHVGAWCVVELLVKVDERACRAEGKTEFGVGDLSYQHKISAWDNQWRVFVSW